MKRMPLIVSFLLFIALCASIAYWALQLFKPPSRPVAAPPRIAQADVSPDAAAALFGGRPGKVAVASNYQLKGVILSGTASDSVAILSANGKPAQAVAVGVELMPGVTVKEVHREYVLLSEGGAVKRVELPEGAKVQVNLASAAPVGTSTNAGPASIPARNQLTPPPVPPQSSQPATSSAASPAAAQSARSPLLPPPAPQTQQQTQQPTSQAQPQPRGLMAPAAPATVVPGAASTSPQAPVASTAAPAQQAAGAAAAPNTSSAPANAAATPAAVLPPAGLAAGGFGAGAPASGASGGGTSSAGGEMLPPSTLQSR